MPLFEFVCQNCQQEFTELCRREEKEVICPSCGSKETAKKFSVFGFSVEGGRTRSSTDSGSCSSCKGGNCSSCH